MTMSYPSASMCRDRTLCTSAGCTWRRRSVMDETGMKDAPAEGLTGMIELRSRSQKAVHLTVRSFHERNRDPRRRAHADRLVPRHAVVDSCAEARSDEHTSEFQLHSFISYAVFCLKKKKKKILTEITPSELDNPLKHCANSV